MAIESINSSIAGYKLSEKAGQPTITTNSAFQQQVIKVEAVDSSKNLKDQENDSQSEGNNEHLSKDISPDKVKKAITDINNKIKSTKTVCSFHFHEDTNRISITVTDKDTHEVIKEIPPEKTLDMIAKVWELAGILVDEKR